MIAAAEDGPQVLHALPGRWRVQLSERPGRQTEDLEQTLRRVRGVRQALVNPRTGNVLIQFDPRTTDEPDLWAALGALTAARAEPAPVPGRPVRLRLVLQGLDRDPDLGRQAVERLERYPTVRARLNPLTCRILVEYTQGPVPQDRLRAEVQRLERPDTRRRRPPEHPLAPGPLVQSMLRTAAGALGLGYLAVRRLLWGPLSSPIARPAEQVAGGVALLQAFPVIQNPLQWLFGKDRAELVLDTTGIVAQVLSGDPLGVALAGAQALRLLTTTLTKRRAWRGYEDLVATRQPVYPGARLTRQSGERSPLDARVVDGAGTALGRDGLPVPVGPGASVPAGSRLFGGPFALDLQTAPSFTPEPRPAPLPKSPYAPYVWLDTLLSLGYAATAAVFTRSVSRVFEALVLVNPRTAVIGLEAANEAAAARAVRAGAVVVGSRPERAIQRPNVLLLDGPRTLVEGWEVSRVVPAGESGDAELLSVAHAVASAAGSPWGPAFGRPNRMAESGAFDGRAASAVLAGTRYTLGTPDAALPGGQRAEPGEYPLLLRDETNQRAVGVVMLRPRLAAGAADLSRCCRERGVACLLLPGDNRPVAEALGQRTGIEVAEAAGALSAIRTRQREHAVVAFVSDSADAAEAFDRCDLAVRLTTNRDAPLPARADVLAPDLGVVAALIETGTRRDRAVRDAVWLAFADDLIGLGRGIFGLPQFGRALTPSEATGLLALAVSWFRLRGGVRRQ